MAPDGTFTLNLMVEVAPVGADVLRSTIRNSVVDGVAQQTSAVVFAPVLQVSVPLCKKDGSVSPVLDEVTV